MGNVFTKLVPDIVQSSIWNESSDMRIVWITMLAIKDKDGVVRGNAATLARIANVPIEATEKALDRFQEPDEFSRTTESEGRRIKPVPGGWYIINHALYRARDYKTAEAERKRAAREKKKETSVRTSPETSGQVPDSSVSGSDSESVYTSGSKQEDPGDVTKPKAKPKPKAKKYSDEFEAAWAAFGRYGSKPRAFTYWKRLADEDRAGVVEAMPGYLACIEAGRTKKQFEGWINPANRLWDMDWAAVLAELTKPIKQRPVESASYLEQMGESSL